MEIKINKSMKTLTAAYGMMKRLDLINLMSGGKMTFDPLELGDKLLEEGQLIEFCNLVNPVYDMTEENTFDECMAVVAAFFGYIHESSSGSIKAALAKSGNPSKSPTT